MTSSTPPQPDHGRTTPPASTYTYDSHSRLDTVTDALGKTTTYDYDALDRLIRTTYADGKYSQYSYDQDGNQLSGTDTPAPAARSTDSRSRTPTTP